MKKKWKDIIIVGTLFLALVQATNPWIIRWLDSSAHGSSFWGGIHFGWANGMSLIFAAAIVFASVLNWKANRAPRTIAGPAASEKVLSDYEMGNSILTFQQDLLVASLAGHTPRIWGHIQAHNCSAEVVELISLKSLEVRLNSSTVLFTNYTAAFKNATIQPKGTQLAALNIDLDAGRANMIREYRFDLSLQLSGTLVFRCRGKEFSRPFGMALPARIHQEN